MDRAVLIGQGRDLPLAAALGPGTRPAPESTPRSHGASPARIELLDTVIRRHIESALAETRGRVEGAHGAARLLGVNPHTLRARMRKLGIEWQRFRTADA